MHFESFDRAVENQPDPDRGDEEATMRVAASIPIGPIFTRQPIRIPEAEIGDDHRRNDGRRDGDEGKDSLQESSIVAVMPTIVAIALGLNMSGMARGAKAILASPARTRNWRASLQAYCPQIWTA